MLVQYSCYDSNLAQDSQAILYYYPQSLPELYENYLLGKVEGVLLSFGTNFISDHSFHYNKFNSFEIQSEKIEKPLGITLSRAKI